MTSQTTPPATRGQRGDQDESGDQDRRGDPTPLTSSLEDPRVPPGEETRAHGTEPGGAAFQIIDLGHPSGGSRNRRRPGQTRGKRK